MNKIHLIDKKGLKAIGNVFFGYIQKEKDGELTTYLNVKSEFEDGNFKLKGNEALFFGYYEEGLKEKLMTCKEGNTFAWKKKEYTKLKEIEIKELVEDKEFLFRSPIDEVISLKRNKIDSW